MDILEIFTHKLWEFRRSHGWNGPDYVLVSEKTLGELRSACSSLTPGDIWKIYGVDIILVESYKGDLMKLVFQEDHSAMKLSEAEIYH